MPANGQAADAGLVRDGFAKVKTDYVANAGLLDSGGIVNVGKLPDLSTPINAHLGGDAAGLVAVVTAKPSAAAVALKVDTNANLATSTSLFVASKGVSDTINRFAVLANGRLEWGSGAAARDTFFERVIQDDGSIALSTPNRVVAASLRFKTDPNALSIIEVPGTNGRRLEISPHDQASSTASCQLQLVPGANVPATEITTQILFMHKPGSNYERFVISTYNNEYQFHSGALGTGIPRSTFFYVQNEAITAWMADRTFKVYKQLDLCNPGDATGLSPVWGSVKAYALNHIGTPHSFRVREAAASQLRLGDPFSLGLPTISFGIDNLVYLARNGTNLQVVGAGFQVAGAFGVNGATAAAKQTLNAAATDAATTQALVNQIRTALITFGLAQ